MLNRLKSKRGAVMESALLFLLVIFLLCFLLTLVALSGHASTKLARTKLENRLALEQIAEDFITYAKENPDDPTAFDNENETYEAAVTEADGVCTLTVTAAAAAPLDPADPEVGEAAPTPPVLLTVQLRVERIADAEGNPVDTVTVLAYRYGAI